MPGTCGVCGKKVVERTNSDGSYKGACEDCNNSNPLNITRHVEQCDTNDCLVCRDYREENGGG